MSLGQLLELALNGNRLHVISADTFRGLDHLRILYLAGNHINRLEDYTFRGLQVCVVSIPAGSHLGYVNWSAVNVTLCRWLCTPLK